MPISSHLAVPSYGAMALKRSVDALASIRPVLAVPSYGAMALKHTAGDRDAATTATCSPLLRGDGPETHELFQPWMLPHPLAVPSYGAMALKPCPVSPGGL